MRTQFVTAIYIGLENTIFNGNPVSLYDRYKKSLKSLADGGYSIVCYTSSNHLPELTKFFYGYNNITFVVEELEKNPFHNKINKIKELHPKYVTDRSWRSRCVEIMWGKFLWMGKHLPSIGQDDYIYWIDAGLFHGGLIPKKYKTANSKNEFDFDRITQKTNLFNKLNIYTKDRILNIRSTIVNHNPDDFERVFGYRPHYGVVGGIFGGKKKLLTEYVAGAVSAMSRVLDSGVLLKEEEIMFHLHNQTPKIFTDFIFNSWYHEDWEDIYDPVTHISFADFFEVL